MKKKFRKVMALLLAAVMVLAMAVTVSAKETTYTLTLQRSTTDTDNTTTTINEYSVYKVATFDFDLVDGSLIYTNLTAEEAFGNVLTEKVLENLASSNVKNADTGTNAAAPTEEGATDTRTDMQTLANSLAELTESTTNQITATATIAGSDSGSVSDLTAGYYLVKETAHKDSDGRIATKYILVAVPNSVTSTTEGETTTYSVNNTATVTLKTSEAGLTKKIVLEDSATGENVSGEYDPSAAKLVDTDVVAIGDTVTYQIDTTIPQYPSYVTADTDDATTEAVESQGNAGDLQYYITDTMSKGLTLQEKSGSKIENPSYEITVAIKNSSATEYTTLDSNAYETVMTAEESGDTTIVIYLSDEKVIAYQGGNVKVTVKATLNENANVGETGNPNSAALTYTNIWDKGDTYTTPEDTVITYTGELIIEKTDSKNKDSNGNALKLAGAKFAIYGPKNKNIMDTEENAATSIIIGSDGKQYAGTSNMPKGVTGTTYYYYETVATGDGTDTDGDGTNDSVLGEAKLTGLDNGTYYAVETKAPTGYNLDATPQKLALKVEKTVSGTSGDTSATESAELETVNGLVDTKGNTLTQSTYKATWKLNEQNSTTANIKNTKGATLPGTGGIGTTIFTVGGIVLVLLAAAMFFVYVRRMKRNA